MSGDRAQALEAAIRDYLDVVDSSEQFDYGTHTGMPWDEASRLEAAAERLRAALEQAP